MTSPIVTDVLVVQGRLVDADTNEPLSRCSVRLTGHQSTGYDLAWRAGDWADPPTQSTGDDGRFRFEFRLPSAFEPVDRARYQLNVSHPWHAAWFSHCTFHVARARGGVDYGDVPLPKGSRPRVRCVDTDGALQPGVLLRLQQAAPADPGPGNLPGGPLSWIRRGAYARTDIDGYLHLDDPLPPGDYEVEVRGRATANAVEAITLPTRDAVEIVVESVAANRSITGRLVSSDELPIGGAHLRAGRRGPSCITQRDGRFVLVADDDHRDDGRSFEMLMARNRRYDGWGVVGEARWGDRDIRFEVPAATTTTFVVTDSDGRPVEGFSLYCLPDDGHEAPGARLAGTFSGGRARCGIDSDTPHHYRVIPHDPRLQSTAWIALPSDTSSDVQVTLAETVVARVRVALRYDAGIPVENACVEVLTAEPPTSTAFVPPATADNIESIGNAGPALLVAKAHCDDKDTAVLRLPAFGDYWLRVSGDNVATEVHRARIDAKATDIPIVVEAAPGGVVTGRLTPVDAALQLDPSHAAERQPSIYSYRSHYRPTLVVVLGDGTRREGIQIADDGAFRCAGLPLGEAEFRLQLWTTPDGKSHFLVDDPPLLGTVQVTAGEMSAVELDVPEKTLEEHSGLRKKQGGR